MLFLLLGCGAPTPVAEQKAPTVVEVPVVVDTPVRSAGWTWTKLATAGQEIGGVRFGGAFSGDDGLDGESLHVVDGQTWLVSHFERPIPALFRSHLQDGVASTEPIDLDPLYGGFQLCAGAPTPWNTHLGSEEYEPDAAIVGKDGKLPARADVGHGDQEIEDEGYNLIPGATPYRYGWAWEVAPDKGAPSPRLAMGRFSHEVALAMPDERSVYLSDDRRGGGLYLFVADKPRDLSAGTLYAAVWGPTVRWVNLGHASEAELAKAWKKPPVFSALFDRKIADTCPEGYTRVTSGSGRECLKVKNRLLASRFETRRMAGVLGATTHLTKEEGLAYDPQANVLYVAISNVTSPMPEPANACGAVYALSLASGHDDTEHKEILSPHVATSARELLRGVEDGKVCRDDAIANPDNLAFVDGELIIAEDTHKRADGLPRLWSWRDGKLTEVFRGPAGSELTGLSAADHQFTLVVQHPDASPSYVGLVSRQ